MTMQAYKEVGRRFPHALLTVQDGFPVHDPVALEESIEEFKSRHGYQVHDVVEITPATPNESLKKFDRPHTHGEDEIRLFLEGKGIFDLRDDDGTWYRFVLEQGDLIVIPAGRVHRFEPTFEKRLRCVRVFQNQAGWVPTYVD